MRGWLLLVGIVWLVIVVIWLALGPGFSIGIRSPIQTMRATAFLGMLIAFLYGSFLIGWVIPLGCGVFGYFSRRR